MPVKDFIIQTLLRRYACTARYNYATHCTPDKFWQLHVFITTVWRHRFV